ncbi:MAG: EscF/YscF/HrpA family type III secretion system needle major subunit [Burkholderiaceae bacterium]|jgi:hypothetical protein
MAETNTTTVDKINLNTVHTLANTNITSMEADVKTQLQALSNGGEVSQADLLRLQFNIAKYTVTASTFSVLVKEISDSLKQTASKIG